MNTRECPRQTPRRQRNRLVDCYRDMQSRFAIAVRSSSGRARLTPIAFKTDTDASNPVKKRKNVLKGPLVLKLEAHQKGSVSLGSARSFSVRDFIEAAANKNGWLDNVSLPLGGSLAVIDQSSVALRIPRIELFDLFLQPAAMGRLNLTTHSLEVTAVTEDCILEGSHHVKSMGLNERYNLDVRINFTWLEAKPSITIDGKISVDVDLTGLQPFCSMPDFILKGAGDAAMATVLSIMMPVFISKIEKEFKAFKGPSTTILA
jgi:hypothetical protein